MRIVIGVIVMGCGFLWFAAGCSSMGSDGPAIVAADGTVTLNGSPVAGATVTFFPEKGPLALAITDLNGKFTLATGTIRGCAVGMAKVTVSAFPPGEEAAPAKAPSGKIDKSMSLDELHSRDKELVEMTISGQKKSLKSLVPERYLKTETSGLSFTVGAGGGNHFNVELRD